MWYADRWANKDSNYNTWAHSFQVNERVWRRTTERSFTDTSARGVNNLLCGRHEAAESTPQLVFITASVTQSQLFELNITDYLVCVGTIKQFSSLDTEIGKNITSIRQYHRLSCGRGLAAEEAKRESIESGVNVNFNRVSQFSWWEPCFCQGVCLNGSSLITTQQDLYI